MASISVAPVRRSPQPGKQQLYQQQVFINRALEHVVLGCQQIQTLNIIPRSFLTLYVNMAQELRALINSRIAEEMRPIEDVDAQYFQQERLKWESRPGLLAENQNQPRRHGDTELRRRRSKTGMNQKNGEGKKLRENNGLAYSRYGGKRKVLPHAPPAAGHVSG